MIYSGSGSSFVSGSNPFQLLIFGILKKHTLNSIKKKNLSTICHFLFHTTVLQYTKSRIHRSKIIFKFFIYLLFHFCWIHADPDPQHCLNLNLLTSILSYIYMCGSVSEFGIPIRTRIQKAPEYGSNMDPDPQHRLKVQMLTSVFRSRRARLF